MADIDDRLTHPRRRAADRERLPVVPELGPVRITNELLDEIAWRVAQQIRKSGKPATADNVTQALSEPVAAPPPATPDPSLRPGKILMIRFQMPLLPWPFRLLQTRKPAPATARLKA
jgi:hypothetical protein